MSVSKKHGKVCLKTTWHERVICELAGGNDKLLFIFYISYVYKDKLFSRMDLK